jgi:fatty-acyl-CoA synthase
MGVFTRIKRETRFMSALNRLLRGIKGISPDSRDLVCDDFERSADRFGDNVAVICEGRRLTYREMDALANRYAHWAKGRGIRRGDTVALLMPNRLEYVAIWMGLAKVGVTTALINNNLTGKSLAHCLMLSGATHVLADTDTWQAFEEVRELIGRNTMLWVLGLGDAEETSARRGLDTAVKGASAVRPDRMIREDIKAGATALYIYTSGTTGMPKAARITHAKAQLYMRAFAATTQSKPTDRVYCALPLYHSTGGLCGVGAALETGGALVIRKRFSAQAFWTDVVENDCTIFVYIGELCRYLVNSPEHPLEREHKIRLAFGNGLRPEIWPEFQKRFRIPEILEFYGSTEGNVSLFNFDGKPGAVGRIPSYLRGQFNIRLVKFDLEIGEPARGPGGLCIEARPGEIGEAIGEIGADTRHAFAGYADKAASEKKILRDVFKTGDAYFRTGDLMRQDEAGYLYFVDRVGDTYRWKGENISTTEVGERLAGLPGVAEVNVYGVPVAGAEGKAGMAAIVAGEGFDIEKLKSEVDHELPAYAQPVFIRLQRGIETTGTFKYTKMHLIQEGFAPPNSKDRIYYRHPEKGYVRLDKRALTKLQAGELKL